MLKHAFHARLTLWHIALLIGISTAVLALYLDVIKF